MEVINKYKAFDGREFEDAEKCIEYEGQMSELINIMSVMPIIPEDCGFTNGHGFILHDKSEAEDVFIKLLVFAKYYIPDNVIEEAIDYGWDCRQRIIGRYFDDCTPNKVYKAWHRFMCIDDQMREWGQPYFAHNPDKGEKIQLNNDQYKQTPHPA